MNIFYYILILILAMWVEYIIADRRNQKDAEKEVANLKEKHTHEISRLEDTLKKATTNYESLNAQHEELLTRLKNEQERYYKLLTENTLAKQGIAALQKDLYCARKHTKKMMKDFVFILSKLLGVKQN